MEGIEDKTYFWDIETSTVTCDNGEEMQVTFLSNVVCMCCETGNILSSIFFRTLEETVEYFKLLESGCIVWSHNLDYEMYHLLREIGGNGQITDKENIYQSEVQEIVFRDKNAPLSVVLEQLPNITFRDTYALFNKGVKALGEELNLPKLDYDYKVVRMPWDELTQLDYDYNERDNIIVANSLYKYMKTNFYKVTEIPLTFTSQVRRDRKKYISHTFGNKAIYKFFFDRNKVLNDFHFFEEMQTVYQGGLTASILTQTKKFIDNKSTSGVIGVDIKSSYPNQMCTQRFPLFTNEDTINLVGELANNYYKLGNFKGCIGYFKFTNIKVKNENYILPISHSQLIKGDFSSDYKIYNGKLISASEVIIPCTNIDVEVINKVYSYDSLECMSIYATTKDRYLRIEEVSFLLDNFLVKESKLGDVKKAKLIINSMYGVKVSNPIKDNYLIENGEVETLEYYKNTIETRQEIYNNYLDMQKPYGGSIDVYSDGVWITSFARQQLVNKVIDIVDMGGKVVYSDTDSIKFYCDTKEEQDTIINNILWLNKQKVRKNSKLPRFKQFKKLWNLSDEDYNLICNLGIWEVEDKKPHKLFVTYGAKKYGYITHDDIVKTTIAGCSKINVPVVINNFAKKKKVSLEKAFRFILSTGTTFDVKASGRTTASKEKRTREEMELMTYQGKRINQYGGIIIKDTTYTLNVSLNDSKLLRCYTDNIETMKIDMEGNVKYE